MQSPPPLRVLAVSMLFDIRRGTVDGRTPEHYLQWFARVAALTPCDAVFFLHDELAGAPHHGGARLLASRPPGVRTVIVAVPWGDVPYAADEASPSADAAAKIPFPRYSALVNSKPKFVLRALAIDAAARGARERPPDVAVWIDAGAGRFAVPEVVLTGFNARELARVAADTAVSVVTLDPLPSPTAVAAAASAASSSIVAFSARGGPSSVSAGLMAGPPAAWHALDAAMTPLWQALCDADATATEERLLAFLIARGCPAVRGLHIQRDYPGIGVSGLQYLFALWNYAQAAQSTDGEGAEVTTTVQQLAPLLHNPSRLQRMLATAAATAKRFHVAYMGVLTARRLATLRACAERGLSVLRIDALGGPRLDDAVAMCRVLLHVHAGAWACHEDDDFVRWAAVGMPVVAESGPHLAVATPCPMLRQERRHALGGAAPPPHVLYAPYSELTDAVLRAVVEAGGTPGLLRGELAVLTDRQEKYATKGEAGFVVEA